MIHHYGQQDDITSLIINNDREALHELVLADYRDMRKKEPNLFVMHFFNINNVKVLRMHKPNSYGDDLSDIRPIVAHVNRLVSQAKGFEPGKNGIPYRITTPVFEKNGKHIGVLEFGILPKYFVDSLNKRFNVKSKILVPTQALQYLTYETNFRTFGDCSVVYQDSIFSNLNLDTCGIGDERLNKTPNIDLNQ